MTKKLLLMAAFLASSASFSSSHASALEDERSENDVPTLYQLCQNVLSKTIENTNSPTSIEGFSNLPSFLSNMWMNEMFPDTYDFDAGSMAAPLSYRPTITLHGYIKNEARGTPDAETRISEVHTALLENQYLTYLRLTGIATDSFGSILPNLKTLKNLDLSCGWQPGDILTYVKDLTNLEELSINSCIDSFSVLANLKNLKRLQISDCITADFASLSALSNLQDLRLCFATQLRDISALNQLQNLKHLSITHSKIKNIAPLDGLKNLTSLSLSSNNITDISPLATLASLRNLNISHNRINTLDPLSGLQALKKLNISDNNIEDMTPLLNLSNLSDLIALWTKEAAVAPLRERQNLKITTYIPRKGQPACPLVMPSYID